MFRCGFGVSIVRLNTKKKREEKKTSSGLSGSGSPNLRLEWSLRPSEFSWSVFPSILKKLNFFLNIPFVLVIPLLFYDFLFCAVLWHSSLWYFYFIRSLWSFVTNFAKFVKQGTLKGTFNIVWWFYFNFIVFTVFTDGV